MKSSHTKTVSGVLNSAARAVKRVATGVLHEQMIAAFGRPQSVLLGSRIPASPRPR
jgi:hypothetical protein